MLYKQYVDKLMTRQKHAILKKRNTWKEISIDSSKSL